MITKEQVEAAGREVSRLGALGPLDPRSAGYEAALHKYNQLTSDYCHQEIVNKCTGCAHFDGIDCTSDGFGCTDTRV